MEKTVKELNALAKSYSFVSALHAITCADNYRSAYSRYLDKYENIVKIWDALQIVLPDEMIDLISKKFAEIETKPSFPDIYAGELNTERIEIYKGIAEEYNVDEGIIRDVFCKGADWYKSLLK